jgi:hypothetical protein
MKPSPAEMLKGILRRRRATIPPAAAKGIFRKISRAGSAADAGGNEPASSYVNY